MSYIKNLQKKGTVKNNICDPTPKFSIHTVAIFLEAELLYNSVCHNVIMSQCHATFNFSKIKNHQTFLPNKMAENKQNLTNLGFKINSPSKSIIRCSAPMAGLSALFNILGQFNQVKLLLH